MEVQAVPGVRLEVGLVVTLCNGLWERLGDSAGDVGNGWIAGGKAVSATEGKVVRWLQVSTMELLMERQQAKSEGIGIKTYIQ